MFCMQLICQLPSVVVGIKAHFVNAADSEWHDRCWAATMARSDQPGLSNRSATEGGCRALEAFAEQGPFEKG